MKNENKTRQIVGDEVVRAIAGTIYRITRTIPNLSEPGEAALTLTIFTNALALIAVSAANSFDKPLREVIADIHEGIDEAAVSIEGDPVAGTHLIEMVNREIAEIRELEKAERDAD